jgi:hypothetical protein
MKPLTAHRSLLTACLLGSLLLAPCSLLAQQGIKNLSLAGVSNHLLTGATLTADAGSTFTVSGVLSGTPTGGTLSLANLTLTLPATVSGGTSSFQPLDSDLTSIAALTTTANGRSLLTATALTGAGLGLTNGSAIDALGAVAVNGGLYRTAANTYAARTITGTAGQITVTNGDGVSGAPTISLPSTITQATTFSSALSIVPAAATQASFNVTASGAADSYARLSSDSGRSRNVSFNTGSARRWLVQATTTAETGSNAGSDFRISSYDDADAAIDNPLTIIRAAGGAMTVARPLAVTSTTASTSTTTGSATFGGGIGVAGAINAGSASGFTYSGGSPVLTVTGNNGGTGRNVLQVTNTDTSTGANTSVTVTSGTVNGSMTSFNTTYATALYANSTAFGNSMANGKTIISSSGTGGYIIFNQGAFLNEVARFAPTSNNFLLGTTTDSSNGKLQLATHTAATGGIGFGTDVQLYRNAAGTLQVSTAAATSMNFDLVRDAATFGYFRVLTGGSRRWAFGANSTAESGANAGSDFQMNTYSDANAYIDSPLTIPRAAGGTVIWARPITTNGTFGTTNTTASTSTTTGALTVAGGMSAQGAGWFGGSVNSAGAFIATAGAGTAGLSHITPDGTAPSVALTQTGRRQWRMRIPASSSNLEFYDNDGAVVALTLSYTTGNASFLGSVKSVAPTGGIGYATGAGGTVTQGTSRTTGVTLDKVSGAITLVSAAGSATYQSFTVTNSAVAATDTIIVNQKSGTDLYEILVTAVAAGSFRITYRTTGGTTTEQPVFNFAVIKAVAS